ncbi:hypothetical protein JB92DRAFT_3132553 [Gautieria morchelliformis]|nr:hypothetical protein JB92DRAFT_3132553 [Gautieria morchelliformis]
MPQPTKKRRINLNISGLRNQKASNLSVPHLKHTESESEGQETPQAFRIYFDSTCVDWSNREGKEDEESDDVEDLKAEEYGDEKFTLQLAALAEKYNPTDQDWTTCIEIFDNDNNPTDAASGCGEWSGDHILEPIITNDVEMQNDTEADDDSDGALETNDGEVQMNDEDAEYWEAELDDAVQDETAAVKDWATLRSEVKTHMKKHSKIMLLSQLNQYMILGNFATLRIRGVTRIKASQEITCQWHDGEGVSFAC